MVQCLLYGSKSFQYTERDPSPSLPKFETEESEVSGLDGP